MEGTSFDVQLARLEERIDREIEALSASYPFVFNENNKRKMARIAGQENKGDLIALGAIMRLRESLAI